MDAASLLSELRRVRAVPVCTEVVSLEIPANKGSVKEAIGVWDIDGNIHYGIARNLHYFEQSYLLTYILPFSQSLLLAF